MYFDTRDYVLTAHNCWFRKRNSKFEMKVPSAIRDAEVYEEIADESTILNCLQALYDRDMSKKRIPLFALDWPRRIGDLILDEFSEDSVVTPRRLFGEARDDAGEEVSVGARAQPIHKWLIPFCDLRTRRESYCMWNPSARIDVDAVDFVSQSGRRASPQGNPQAPEDWKFEVQYCDAVAKPKAWGSTLELSVPAECYEVPLWTLKEK